MVFNGTVAVPSNATMNGTCNSMALTWPAGYGAAFTNVNRLSMTFDRAYDASKNESYYRPATMTAALVFDPVHFPGAADAGPVQMTVDHPWFFMSAPFNKSYSCNADWYVMANRTTPMVDLPGRNVTGMFMFKDLQIQPYMTEASNGRFDTCKFFLRTRCRERILILFFFFHLLKSLMKYIKNVKIKNH